MAYLSFSCTERIICVVFVPGWLLSPLTKVLELAAGEGQLVLKLPGTLEGVTVLAASYAEDGRMTGLQWLRQPEAETVLSVSGAVVRVFFLNGSCAPVLPVLSRSAA